MEENMILYLSKAEVESVGVTMSETVEILGAGVQGFSNLEALKVLFPIKKVGSITNIEENCS